MEIWKTEEKLEGEKGFQRLFVLLPILKTERQKLAEILVRKDPEVKEDDNTGEEEGDCWRGFSQNVGAGIQGTGWKFGGFNQERACPQRRSGGSRARAGWSELPGSPSLPARNNQGPGELLTGDGGWSPRENILSSLMFL